MQNFSFTHQLLNDKNASFIVDDATENSPFKPQFLFPQSTQITLSKDFDLFKKKFTRKTCNLKFDPAIKQDDQKMTAILNKLPNLDIYELKISLQPCHDSQEDRRRTVKSFLRSLENLKKLPNLSKLYLDLSFHYFDFRNFIERLCESLKRLARLRHLYISLWPNDLTEYKILIFMSSLKCLKSLRFFELVLTHTEKLNTRGINELCKSLGYLQKLRGLSFDLSDCLKLNDDHIEKLFESIKTLRNLSSLSLFLGNLPELTINGVYILLSLLNSDQEPDLRDDYQIIFAKYLEASPLKLSKLHLDLFSSHKTPKGFATNLAPYCGLTALDLDLSANVNLHAGELMEICFCLGYLKHLSKLSLNLSKNRNLGDEAIRCLSRAIRSLRLVEFDLRICECRGVIPSSWITLFQALRASIGMKKFALLYYSLPFGVDGSLLKQLGLCLKGMKSLDFLSLGFLDCSLDDACLGEIAGFLENARNLRSLQLDLAKNLSLTCQGFERIFFELNEMIYLRKLSFGLNSECFAKNQRKLWSWPLEVLELQVSWWDEIQFLAFCKNLGELSKLKSLDLKISHGSDIYPETVIDLRETIRKIKSLKSSECFGYINTCYELNGKSFWILWEIKKILAESNESILAQYEERLKSFQQQQQDQDRNGNRKKRWSFTLCGVTLW